MITIHYSAARCGAGKTRWACERIAKTPGCYLLAVDRRDVFARRVETIEEFAAEHGTHPKVVQFYSKSEKWEGGISDVRRSVREAGCEYASFPHVVVVITHEALKSSDLSTYTGWTLIIDEVPTVWTHEEICTPVLWKYLRQVYNLIPVGDSGWSEVQAKADGASVADHHLDTYLAPMAVFHKRVKDQGVFAQLTDWQDAAGRKPWSWFSIWNLEELSAFEKVYLLANAFEQTVTYKLLASTSNTSVRFEPFDIPGATPWLPRAISIKYFASGHTAGTAFWTESVSGQECLRRISWWVNAHSDADNHYWSCNLGLYPDHALVGKKVSPRIAGSNDYKDLTCGTFIYTAKPSQAEERVFDWFGISREEVIRSREFEDLVQMFWRCSVREAGDQQAGRVPGLRPAAGRIPARLHHPGRSPCHHCGSRADRSRPG